MPGPANFLDDISNDLAVWIDQTASEVALAFAPGRAPFSANVTEEQKLEYYRSRLFNPDGTPNAQGRAQEIQRLGAEGFGMVYRAVVQRWPELRVPDPPPLEVPEQWPAAPPSGSPPTPPPGAPGSPPGPPGVPASVPAPRPIAGLRPSGPPRTPVGPPPPSGPLPSMIPHMAKGGIVTQPTVALIGEAGPEMVVPLTPQYMDTMQATQYQPPATTPEQAMRNLGTGFSPEQQPPQPGEIQTYIDQAARARGIDPEVAMSVAYFEGGRDPSKPDQAPFTDPAVRGTFKTGSSWWPFQLHYGGDGYQQLGTTAGLGNDFTAATGYQPGDPAAWKASVDYALDQALKRGWYPTYYGSQPAGVSQWQGIPRQRG